MNINPTIKEIAETFASYGYIVSDYGIMQYNPELKSFDYVSDTEILNIFQRVYPNYERRILKVDMIKKHLPRISDNNFHMYDLCKEVDNYNLNETKLNQEIQKLVKYNDTRKKDIPELIKGTDYDNCIQFLINNNIFTDCTLLFQYTDNDFEVIGLNHIKHIFKDTITDKMTTDKYMRIIYIGCNELTYITDVKEDLNMKRKAEILTEDNWNNYQRINDLIRSIQKWVTITPGMKDTAVIGMD